MEYVAASTYVYTTGDERSLFNQEALPTYFYKPKINSPIQDIHISRSIGY